MWGDSEHPSSSGGPGTGRGVLLRRSQSPSASPPPGLYRPQQPSRPEGSGWVSKDQLAWGHWERPWQK